MKITEGQFLCFLKSSIALCKDGRNCSTCFVLKRYKNNAGYTFSQLNRRTWFKDQIKELLKCE